MCAPSSTARRARRAVVVGLATRGVLGLQQQQQPWNPTLYAQKTGFVAQLGRPVLDLLPRPPARVLDLGCGDGSLTLDVAGRGYEVIGMDADPAMVRAAEEARQRWRRSTTPSKSDGQHSVGSNFVAAFAGDAQQLPVAPLVDAYGPFDAVLSNAALHWMPDHAAVASGVAALFRESAARSDASESTDRVFCGECGGAGNVAGVRAALGAALAPLGLDEASLCPWTFPEPLELCEVLEAAGFRVDELKHFARPVAMDDPADWVRVFGGAYLAALPEGTDSERFLAAFREHAKDYLAPGGTAGDVVSGDAAAPGWLVDYVRLRWRAVYVG